MSQEAFYIFNRCFSIVAALLFALGLTVFLRPALKDRGRQAAVFLINMAVWLLCEGLELPPGSLGLFVGLSLLLAAKSLGVDRPRMVLLTLLYLNTRITSGLMAESIYYAVEHLLPAAEEPVERVLLRAALVVTFFLATHTALMWGMLLLLRRRLGRLRLQWRELAYLGLIPAAGILFGQMMARLLFEVKDGMLLQLYERHPLFLGTVPLLALLFYLGAYLTIAFWQGMERLRQERETYFMERQQADAIRERMGEAERLYRQAGELRHELRSHMTNIRGLAQSGQCAEIDRYLQRMDESLRSFALTAQTGNAVTDVILSGKRQQCEERKIDLKADFHWPEGGGYDAFDVGIILHNLLQNAVEACGSVPENRRWITLTGKKRGRFFLIEVRNSFEGSVTFGPEGLPLTTKKENVSLHGLGLGSVRREAEKYMGELELQAEDQTFCAAVLLQERSDPQ